jgi:hypothetical protein
MAPASDGARRGGHGDPGVGRDAVQLHANCRVPCADLGGRRPEGSLLLDRDWGDYRGVPGRSNLVSHTLRTLVLSTRFTELVGCRVPLQLAGMGGVATPELAGAVPDAADRRCH